MRLVTPVSTKDYTRLPNWIELAKHLNCLQQHEMHFIVSRSIESEVRDAKSALEGHCAACEVHVIDHEPSRGWPFAPNIYFWHACNFMGRKPDLPWQMVELDCIPIRANAFDAIAIRYASAGTPFFGKVGPTPWRDLTTGRVVPSMFGPGDVMMSGCGVYPGNIAQRSKFKGLISDFMKGEDSINVPWDMHLRAVMKKAGMGHTTLIADHWNTGNYRIENNALVCDANETHEIYLRNPNWEHRKCGGIVNADAVLVHGCKDDTLFSLVMSDSIPYFTGQPQKKAELPPVAIRSMSAETFITTAPDPKVAALEKKVDQLTDLMTNFLKAQTQAQVPAPAPKVAAQAGDDKQFTLEDVLAKLPESGKIKISDLSIKTQIPLNRLRPFVESHPDKFAMSSGPAGWIGKANQEALT